MVQGDVSEEIEEFLLEKYPVIPEDNIELVEDKKKKASGAGGEGVAGPRHPQGRLAERACRHGRLTVPK